MCKNIPTGILGLAGWGLFQVRRQIFRRWLNLPPMQPTTRSSELEAEVQQLLQQGQKIQAVIRVRERSDSGLKAAKAYVDRLERGDALPLPPLSCPVTLDDVPPGLVEEAGTLLARGQKIQAIKLVKEHTGMGLREARDWVAELQQKLQ